MKTEVNLAGIRMKNPVMPASGTFGYGEEYSQFVDLNKLGAIVTKSITLEEKLGNPSPRITDTNRGGVLNSIGLENVGVDRFIEEKLPYLRHLRIAKIINISGESVDEYVKVAEKLDKTDVNGLEVNVSCPNVEKGLVFGTSPELTYELVSALRKTTELPLIIKLTPNVSEEDLIEVAKSAEGAGANALSLINTIKGMAIDIEKREPVLGGITGGLSGPCIKPVGVRMVYVVKKAVKLPLIGVGGIMNGEDAIEYILVGASAVQVGTANFVNPKATIEVIKGIEKYMKKHDVYDINNLINQLKIK